MLLCTGIFTAFALPAAGGLGTLLLESLAHANHSLVSIRSVDEVGHALEEPASDAKPRSAQVCDDVTVTQAVVIGGALSMSSSAFVLQVRL